MVSELSSLPSDRALSGYGIVYFGNDWSAENRTSSHHIAARLAHLTNVLYIETPGMRAPEASARDFRKLWRKLAKTLQPPRSAAPGLWVMTLPQIPFRGAPFVGLLNEWLGRVLVRRAVRRLGFDRRISWFVVPHPGPLARRLGERLTVYYCIDDYAAFPGVDAAAIQALDDRLTRESDIVFVASPALLDSKKELNSTCHFSPHGVDVDLFGRAADPLTEAAAQTAALPRPVIGYFGSLGAWIDFDLIAYLARSRPEWTFLLIGYASADAGELRSCKNVVFTGPQPYATLPKWARAFDAAIVPYRLTQQVRNANPLKLREYLATGKPVVSVVTPETARFSDVVYLAETREEFLRALERALAEDSPERSRSRRAAVAGSSWDERVRETVALVAGRLGART